MLAWISRTSPDTFSLILRASSSCFFCSLLNLSSDIYQIQATGLKVDQEPHGGLQLEIKDASQDFEAKAKTSEDHAEGKPSSETLNKSKVKVRDALT